MTTRVEVADPYTLVIYTELDRHLVRLEVDGQPPRMGGELEALVGAAAAMKSDDGVLKVSCNVGPEFRASFESATQLLASWFPELHPVHLISLATKSAPPPRSGTYSFFSAGVDSFFTAISCKSSIESLVLVNGFDMRLGSATVWTEVSDHAQIAATELGRPLALVQTDLRDYSDRYLSWVHHYHGFALAAIAHSLGAAKAFVPASFQHGGFPWGSHPELDPLLGGAILEIVHHGDDVSRVEKVRTVAANGTAMRHLRVCTKNQKGGDFYNCGICEKCVRTQIGLAAVGALGRCSTLPSHLDVGLVRDLPLRDAAAATFAEENLAALACQADTQALHRALRGNLRRTRATGLARRGVGGIPGARWLRRMWNSRR